MKRYSTRHIADDLQRKMVFVGGPRQVGKTVLALTILQGDENHPAYLNWDYFEDKRDILKEKLLSNQDLIVLDEIHKYKQWRNLVKGLYDKRKSTTSFLITGSARLDYYRKGGDSLQGRYHYYRLHPFSLCEVNTSPTQKDLDSLLKFGGFPEPFLSQSETQWKRWQRERLARVIKEDLVTLEQVKEISQLEVLSILLQDKVGSLLSINSLREDLSASHEAVNRWVKIFENLYYCFLLTPYGAKKINALKKDRKLFMWDWSLCKTPGARFENLVASNLLKYCHFIEDTQGDDITKNVITALQVKLTVGETASGLGKGTKNLEAYLKLLKGRYHHNRFNRIDNEIARRLYGEAIALDPNYARAYVLLAWTYFNEAVDGWTKTHAKSFEKAVGLAKKAISLNEQNPRAYMVLANVYAKTGQFEKAAAAQKKALSFDPADTLVNAFAGNALYTAGKFKQAISFFKKAIRIDPKHPTWYMWPLGGAYFWMGQYEEAIAVFQKLISREPENADAHAFLGIALIAAGKPEEAIPMFDKALSLNPDRPGWYVGNLSVARACTGQTEEAITTMQEVFNSNPKDAESCRYLSYVLIYGGRHEEALLMAKKSISLRPKPEREPIAYETLGFSYLVMGQYEEAIAAFKTAIDLWPDFMSSQIGLTASYSLVGRMEEARAEAAEVLRINPKTSLESIGKYGWYNFQRADKERFINALQKAGLK